VKYMLLIYEAEADWAALSQEEKGKMFGEYMAFTNDLKARGQYVSGAPLQPTSTSTTVRVRDGRMSATDGPFAETREQLGGYYLVDAGDLDEAIALAARIPAVRMGSIEVRPVLEIPARPGVEAGARNAAAGR
jgi:hypothetical protein